MEMDSYAKLQKLHKGSAFVHFAEYQEGVIQKKGQAHRIKRRWGALHSKCQENKLSHWDKLFELG